MNRNLISTLELLNDRINRLEQVSMNRGSSGVFLGTPMDDLALEIISKSKGWFADMQLEPDDLFHRALNNDYLEPDSEQVMELAKFIQSRCTRDKKGDLYIALKRAYRGDNLPSVYIANETWHGIRMAMTEAFPPTSSKSR
jgi:hypothetical protein